MDFHENKRFDLLVTQFSGNLVILTWGYFWIVVARLHRLLLSCSTSAIKKGSSGCCHSLDSNKQASELYLFK